MKKTDKELYEYIKGKYYSDIEEGILWEPFENWSDDEIEELIQSDVRSLKKFMEE